MDQEAQITELLQRANAGDEASMDRAIEAIYSDLRRVASFQIKKMHGSRSDALTLQPTALVNETYLRLLTQQTAYANRSHLIAIATRLMLRVLIDYQRAKAAEKRGGDRIRVTLSGLKEDSNTEAGVSDLMDALEQLEKEDQRKADVVRLRAIWGLGMGEIADLLEVSLATVERDWRFAKSWLADELEY
ncbi:MAG: ECF-type sigma factor [Pseudomonadota bacterium]